MCCVGALWVGVLVVSVGWDCGISWILTLGLSCRRLWCCCFVVSGCGSGWFGICVA